jgi:hypothetical protein
MAFCNISVASLEFVPHHSARAVFCFPVAILFSGELESVKPRQKLSTKMANDVYIVLFIFTHFFIYFYSFLFIF